MAWYNLVGCADAWNRASGLTLAIPAILYRWAAIHTIMDVNHEG
jgi:hypothetical protein